MSQLLNVRACWMSDLHLGGRRRCKQPLKTLKKLNPHTLERLVMLGDWFDPMAEHLPTIAHNQKYVTHFVRTLAQLAATLFAKYGQARVLYHEGNHDPFAMLWPWLQQRYPQAADILQQAVAQGHIRLVPQHDVELYAGLWECHGHQCDVFHQVGQSFTHGTGSYATAIMPQGLKRWLNTTTVHSVYNLLAWWAHPTHWSRHHTTYPWLRRGGVWFKVLIRRFHHKLVDHAKQAHNATGVICGHTHLPWIRQYCNGLYLNCGESLDTRHGTFLVLTHHGHWLVLPHASKVKLVWWQRWLARPLRKLGVPVKLKKRRINKVVAAFPPKYKDQPITAALF